MTWSCDDKFNYDFMTLKICTFFIAISWGPGIAFLFSIFSLATLGYGLKIASMIHKSAHEFIRDGCF